FTQGNTGSLGALSVDEIDQVVQVWNDRYQELGKRRGIKYVMPFENRGPEVGVTIPHPHGQIYAYPFVPPIPATALREQRRHLARHGRGLLDTVLAAELEDGRRLVQVEDTAAAWLPVFARYAYELWIAPRRVVPSLDQLRDEERRDLARALAGALRRLDAL